MDLITYILKLELNHVSKWAPLYEVRPGIVSGYLYMVGPQQIVCSNESNVTDDKWYVPHSLIFLA